MSAQLKSWAAALGGAVSGSSVSCPSPGHSAKDRSLSVTPSATSPGGFVVHSFTGVDPIVCRDHVRAKLGLPAFKSNGDGARQASSKRVKIKSINYEYRDPAGALRYRKERQEYDDGHKSFQINPRGRGGSPPMLYGCERLADAREGQSIFIVEGEKKVDALSRLGAIAVSADAGSNSKWLPAHAAMLRGLQIMLWADSDEPGEYYIANAARAIRAENPNADIRIIRPFGRPNGAKGLDVCDWSGDADALAQLVAAALPYEPIDASAPSDPLITRQPPEIITRRASEIKPEPIAWLWKHWLARGKLHIIAGVPETGKTTIALSYSAIASSGGDWPDGTRATVGSVLIWTAEDDADDTLVPRLMRMNADLSRIHFIEQARSPDGKPRPFNPATDMSALVEKAKAIGDVSLLILDPIVAAMPMTHNSHNNAESRNGMQPVVDFARASDIAVIGIGHLTKGTAGKDPLERINGSGAFGALPRLVMGAAKNEAGGEDKYERIMVRIKSNVGPSGGGFGYHIDVAPLLEQPDIEATRIVWELPIEGTARELLADAEGTDDDDKTSKVAEAKQFLKIALEKGERPVREIIAEAELVGISERTLQRTAKEITGKRRSAMGWHWWLLP